LSLQIQWREVGGTFIFFFKAILLAFGVQAQIL